MSAHTILFLNQKGGVGKTTSVVNLGSALARSGHRVLLIDLDSQANMSSALALPRDGATMYQVMAKTARYEDAIIATSVKGLYAVTTSTWLD